jgi:hypothetical protein
LSRLRMLMRSGTRPRCPTRFLASRATLCAACTKTPIFLRSSTIFQVTGSRPATHHEERPAALVSQSIRKFRWSGGKFDKRREPTSCRPHKGRPLGPFGVKQAAQMSPRPSDLIPSFRLLRRWASGPHLRVFRRKPSGGQAKLCERQTLTPEEVALSIGRIGEIPDRIPLGPGINTADEMFLGRVFVTA